MKATMLLLAVVLCACTERPKPDIESEKAAIRALIDATQIAWNNGDIETFMEIFWKSDSLQFISPRGINRGWQETLNDYTSAYPDRKAMGTLHYELIRITPLADNFLVSGKYTLSLLGGNRNGTITLIFSKIDGKWVAIYNHTS